MIYSDVAAEGLYIVAAEMASYCFRSAANRVNAIAFSFWAMCWSRFHDNSSTDSENVYNFGKHDSSASFSGCVCHSPLSLLDHRNWGPIGLTVVYALQNWLISHLCHVHVAFANMNFFGITYSSCYYR